MFGIPAGFVLCLALPVRVVPDQEPALFLRFGEPRLHGCVVVVVRVGCLADRLAVADEEGVEVAGRHAARDFAAVNYQHAAGFAGRRRDFVRFVAVEVHEPPVFLFQQAGVHMVGDGDEVESLRHRLVDAGRGPYRCVREDGVYVQLSLERLVSLDVGNDNPVGDGGARRDGEKRSGQQQIKILFHVEVEV